MATCAGHHDHCTISAGALPMKVNKDVDEPGTPTASTATFQGCADHLCQKRDCNECVGDFKPLLECDDCGSEQCTGCDATMDDVVQAQLRELGWSPGQGNAVDYFDEDGDSLLHTAARLGKAEAVEALLRMGIAPDVVCHGECECTPLIVARRWCNMECVRLLMEYGANVGKANAYGESAVDVREKGESTAATSAQMTAMMSQKSSS